MGKTHGNQMSYFLKLKNFEIKTNWEIRDK